MTNLEIILIIILYIILAILSGVAFYRLSKEESITIVEIIFVSLMFPIVWSILTIFVIIGGYIMLFKGEL